MSKELSSRIDRLVSSLISLEETVDSPLKPYIHDALTELIALREEQEKKPGRLSEEEVEKCMKAVSKVVAIKEIVKENPDEELIPPQSTCRVRLAEPPPCDADFSDVMSWILCHTWYSVAPIQAGIFLVEQFRENFGRAWGEYKKACAL